MSDALALRLAQQEARKVAGPVAEATAESVATTVATSVAERTAMRRLPADVAAFLRANPPPPGDPGLVWRGHWSIGTTYAVADAVEWEGSSYVALRASLGERPPTSAWDLLARKGEPGPPGVQGPGGVGGGASGPFALSVRVLTADATIPADMSAVVVGPLNLNGFTVTLGSNAALGII